MRRKLVFVLCLAFAILSLPILLAAQGTSNSPPSGDWIRVRGGDGDFSFDVPAKHRLFYNESGFSVSQGSGDFLLRNVYFLTAFVDGALISAEVFEGNGGALDTVYSQDAFAKKGRKVRAIKIGEAKGKEVENRTDEYYSLRWFLRHRSQIFVLTAASRTGELPPMRRFLDSLVVGKAGSVLETNSTPIGKLNKTEVVVDFDLQTPRPDSAPTPKPEPNVKPTVIVRMTRASFVPEARESGVDGVIRLKLLVAEDGFIPKVTVNRQLPQGLLRQSLFAALRSKFLPREKDGKPVEATKTVEFSFGIR